MEDSDTPDSLDLPPDSETPGGQGGPHGLRLPEDIRLAARALACGWNVPQSVRPIIVDKLVSIILDVDSKPRQITAASRALFEADRVTLAAVGVAIAAETHEDVLKRLAELEQTVADQKGDDA